jgi:hypothetical protein
MPEDISQYLNDRTFDAETTRTIVDAYEKARRMLGNRLQPPVFREVLAKRIIYWATTGEKLNSDQLARRALLALGYDPEKL